MIESWGTSCEVILGCLRQDLYIDDVKIVLGNGLVPFVHMRIKQIRSTTDGV